MASRARLGPALALAAAVVLSALAAFWITQSPHRSRTPSQPNRDAGASSEEGEAHDRAAGPTDPAHLAPRREPAPEEGAAPEPRGGLDSLPVVVDEDLVVPYPDLPDGGCPKGSKRYADDGGAGCGFQPEHPEHPDGGMLKNGPWSEEVNGMRATGQYVDGKRDGPWTVRDSAGNVRWEFGYEAGQQQGVSREYDEHGVLVDERHYFHGALHGPATIHMPDGSIIKESYDRGLKTSWERVAPP